MMGMEKKLIFQLLTSHVVSHVRSSLVLKVSESPLLLQ